MKKCNLSLQEIHDFAQWFAFHYKNPEDTYPNQKVFELVSQYSFSSIPVNEEGFQKFIVWYALENNIYGERTKEWVIQHLNKQPVLNGLLRSYQLNKQRDSLFILPELKDIMNDHPGLGFRQVVQ